jgi:hypothetical protein
MCLRATARSVDQYAKKVNLKDIAKGRQPAATVLAWRAWNLDSPQSLTPKLKSRSASSLWTPGKPMDAHKAIIRDNADVGVHAYKTIDDLINANQVDYSTRGKFDVKTVVVGQVLLWGLIAEHKEGYRAEHGYPFKLYANGPALQVRLAETYGCLLGRDFIPRLLKAA